MQTIITLFIIYWILSRAGVLKKKKKEREMPKGRTPLATAERAKASAVPNKPKRPERSRTEEAMERRTRISRQACDYEAVYSKGRPDRIGDRGDYEPVTPRGMDRIHCRYCNAENFVPEGSHDHYHCYFCWEKL